MYCFIPEENPFYELEFLQNSYQMCMFISIFLCGVLVLFNGRAMKFHIGSCICCCVLRQIGPLSLVLNASVLTDLQRFVVSMLPSLYQYIKI